MPVFTSSIEVTADYPTIRPSLNLNFARSRALDPSITFTRASVGTYVGRDGLIKTVGENEARFDHDPETLESLGLLIEEGRTNYCGNSEMLANWGFGVGSDAFTASSGAQLSANPDGSSPAYHYVPSSTAGFHRFNRQVTVPTLDTNYVISLFVKRVTAGSVSNMNRFVELEATGGWNGNSSGTGQTGTTGGSAVTFDMENLVIETQTDNLNGYVGDAKIEPYPNGWYRLSYVFNPGIGSNFAGQVWWGHCNSIAGDGGGETGNGNPSFYFWGASVENGSFITSHIPTPDNSSVTRSVDQAYIVGDNVPLGSGVDEYSFYVRGRLLNTDNIGGISRGLVGMGSSSSNRIRIPHNNSSQVEIYSGGSLTAALNTGDIGTTERKIALAVKKDDFAMSMDGGTVQTDTSGDIPTFINNIALGCSTYDPEPLNYPSTSYIKEFRIYPKRLTNAQLQLLTS